MRNLRSFTFLGLAVLLALLFVLPAGAAQKAMFGGKAVPGGVYLYTDQTQTTGDIYFVDDSGTDAAGYGKSPNSPVATIDYAISLCTEGQGDTIYVMPGHAETVTSAITMDVAGVSIIGLGYGSSRPTVTPNGAIDALTITAADCRVENIVFAVPGTDEQTADINIAAARAVVKDTVHHGSTGSNNKVAIITITSAGHDFLIDGARIYNDTVECGYGIRIEGAAKRGVIRGVMVYDSIGFTYGALADEATALGLFVDRCVFSNAKADTVCIDFDHNTTGITRDTFANGRNTTILSNISTGTGMAFYETYGVEEASKNGMLMPAVDAD